MAAFTQRARRGALLSALIVLTTAGQIVWAQAGSDLLTPPPPRTPGTTAAPAPTTLFQAPATNKAPPIVSRVETPSIATSPARQTTSPVAGSAVKVTKGQGVLPNENGQVWREYDISPYTLRVRDVSKPEQAIIDWILRETGTEVWFAEPLGILNASSTTLRVYHTPEMQERVRSIVERFVSGDTEAHALGVRLITVGSPNWRVRALSLLKPVDVKSPGVEAWLLSRENAASLVEQLKARADFREHSAPRIDIANGQSQTLARKDTKPYTRGVQLRRDFPFYDLIPGKIEEGYSLQISPLM